MFKLTTNDIEGQTSEITDSLDELARKGARRMIAAALELEAEQYVQALDLVALVKAGVEFTNGEAEKLQLEPAPEVFPLTPSIFAAEEALIHNIGQYLQFKYCPFCGTELALQENGGRPRPACPNCGFVQFRNPVPGVVVLIEKEGIVLLGKRRGGYGAGMWGLPQGYIEYDEDFLTAAIREVKEETGLNVEIRAILNVVANLLSPGLHTLAIVLAAGVVGGQPRAGDDLETLQWVPLSGPLPELAFEADEWIIARYRKTGLEGTLPVDPDFAGYVTGKETSDEKD
jgi:8-oxo-dGTP diphosphatase